MFLHDLAAMTQFNYQTKVQKPLRRCLISDPVEEEDHPRIRNLILEQPPSTGTAEPASTRPVTSTPVREAADLVQLATTPELPLDILAHLVLGTAGPQPSAQEIATRELGAVGPASTSAAASSASVPVAKVAATPCKACPAAPAASNAAQPAPAVADGALPPEIVSPSNSTGS